MKILATLCTAAILSVGLGSAPTLAAPASTGHAQVQNAQFNFRFGTDTGVYLAL